MMKDMIKSCLARGCFWTYQKGIRKNFIQVKKREETLETLLASKNSLVRFGDGEIRLIAGESLSFQKADDQLAQRLKQILETKEKGLLVSLPDVFTDVSDYVKKSQEFWRVHLLFYRKIYVRYCRTDRIYETTSFSRPYITYRDRSNCPELFAQTKQLWKGKDILIVEGATSHNGVENDLFEDALSIERIICPETQAWQSYERIYAECRKHPVEKLVLVALGPSGKVLTQDLFRQGYRVIDIGNLDMEYSWFCMGAEQKVPLEKHSIKTREDNERAGYHDYLAQIVAVIH